MSKKPKNPKTRKAPAKRVTPKDAAKEAWHAPCAAVLNFQQLDEIREIQCPMEAVELAIYGAQQLEVDIRPAFGLATLVNNRMRILVEGIDTATKAQREAA